MYNPAFKINCFNVNPVAGGLCLLVFILLPVWCFAQKPFITYPINEIYTINKPIQPLIPNNTGGAIPNTPYNYVTTLAGNTLRGYADGKGSDARFRTPAGLVVAPSGDIYMTDNINQVIQKVTPDGTVTTIAGTGGIAGDITGPIATAIFNAPWGIVYDAAGNLFISDVNNRVIKKITSSGIVSVFAGGGVGSATDGQGTTASFGFMSGMVIDDSGNIFVTSSTSIRKITPTGMVSTFATLSYNTTLRGLTIDRSGNLYVSGNNSNAIAIQKISPAGVVTNFAGTAASGLGSGVPLTQGAVGLLADKSGNIYAGDFKTSIKKIAPDGKTIDFAGNGVNTLLDGPLANASVQLIFSMAFDAIGSIYIAESGAIRKIAYNGYILNGTLPPGLSFDPTTGIISGTPTTIFPATDYNVTAYNATGNSTAFFRIQVTEPMLTFNPIAPKFLCDADFDPGATTIGGTLTYASNNPAVATIINGKIHITGIGTATITADNSYSQQTQTLTVGQPVITGSLVPTANASGCEGESIAYLASVNNAGVNPTYKWEVNGIDMHVGTQDFRSATLKKGDQVKCTVTNNTCPATGIFTTEVTLNPLATIGVSITSSATTAVCPGTAITFTATASNVTDAPQYAWTVNDMPAGTNNPQFTSSIIIAGDRVSCSITSNNPCLTSNTAISNTVIVDILGANGCLVTIPNTFTPNGDGYNDTWVLTLPVTLTGTVKSVNVFSRSGQLVFKSTGYKVQWDGTSNGKPLPAGTYFYMIDADNEKKISGTVTIIR